MIALKVSVKNDASKFMRGYVETLSGPEKAGLNKVAGKAAVLEAAAYHREFDRAGKWRGKNYMGKGGGEGSAFGSTITAGWSFGSSDQDGAIIFNDADHYAHKVRGGTIRAKRAKALTIPIIPEARGRLAKDYEIFYHTRLFTIKGKRALFEQVEAGAKKGRKKKGKSGASGGS
ncbi:hypothetical protein JIN85_20865, partial [Luteolibacter pohnpeiensis]